MIFTGPRRDIYIDAYSSFSLLLFFFYPSISGSDHSSLFSASHFISSLFQLGIPLCAFNILFLFLQWADEIWE
ncbi:hypothetical protein C8Q69DRAFT_300431 [Paecilomyces variotii]|uniref:Uncharacterized protein n=1 Tax=Byssochlamys spectabilis TaxID=264951 RepID=A0A443HSE4_BYSSP|nr:hypothetical protein C8Q69DRAFT_300431 [Paecilomyces variotii]RWQ94670.1 hypothetical protein C8Q69DRAFT_300431 [Paecilomyces variotii]